MFKANLISSLRVPNDVVREVCLVIKRAIDAAMS